MTGTQLPKPTHLPTQEIIDAWPVFTPESPLRLLVSACLNNDPCGVNGTSYGDYPFALRFIALPNVKMIKFCPEHAAFGTPRKMPDMHGGNGFDLLDGHKHVRVLNDEGEDWTDGMVTAARTMRDLAIQNKVHLALMMDVSAACGSTVIYSGDRRNKAYQRGAGVVGAHIIRAGIPLVSQRDERTLAKIFEKLGASEVAKQVTTDGLDHYERDWYQTYFAASPSSSSAAVVTQSKNESS